MADSKCKVGAKVERLPSLTAEEGTKASGEQVLRVEGKTAVAGARQDGNITLSKHHKDEVAFSNVSASRLERPTVIRPTPSGAEVYGLD